MIFALCGAPFLLPDAHGANGFPCSSLLTRIKTLFTGTPVPVRFSGNVSSPLIALLDSRPLNSPEILRLFTRSPEAMVLNPHYIQNMADSIREGFAPWFERKTDLSFPHMLKLQHSILTLGLDGKSLYLSTAASVPMKKRAIGKFRYELTSLTSGEHLEFSLADLYPRPSDYPDSVLDFLAKKPDRVRYWTAINRVPVNERPEADLTIFRPYGPVSNLRFRMTYPKAHHSKTYVRIMQEVMEEIRSLPENTPGEVLFPLLADYIQLFSVGLPFKRVNYVLMKHGFRGLENGSLDLFSAMLPTEEFRKAFAIEVKKAQ
ncbi:MAG: hypothetical protein EBX52_01105 [Proteobacteria bacterium]|nr:hypothetical protein [Pseudomonadota bacterium]